MGVLAMKNTYLCGKINKKDKHYAKKEDRIFV